MEAEDRAAASQTALTILEPLATRAFSLKPFSLASSTGLTATRMGCLATEEFFLYMKKSS